MKKIFLMAIAAVLLSGCAAYSSKDLNQLRPGYSTVDDASARFGRPKSKTASPNNTTLYQWITITPFISGHIAILFGPDGKMIRVTHQYNVE